MPHSSSRSKTVYTIRNPDGDPFCYSPETDPTLEIIGLVLWITEGDKTQCSLANGNVSVIKKYLEFLRRICLFEEKRIKAVIHCHDTMPYNECLTYWSKNTGIPAERFNKPYLKKDKGGSRTYPYGICRIVGTNIRLIKIFKDRLKALGLVRD